MRAFMISEANKGVVIELPRPAPGQDEVLIRVRYTGICGSDLHSYEGRHIRRMPPLVPGHETSGVIAAVGPAVRALREGDRVCVLPERGCGACAACRKGWTNLCPDKSLLGTAAWPGAFAEYITAPASQVLILPDSLPLDLGALAEPAAVAVHALRQGRFTPGESVLVFGAGGIGALIIALARRSGAGRIIACDLKDFNLARALELGADTVLNSRGLDAGGIVERCPDGLPVDAVFVAASHHDLINQAFALASPKGKIVLVGQFNRPGVIDVDKARLKEQTIYSSFTYVRDDFEEAVRLLAEDPASFAPVITGRITLDETDACLRGMIRGDLDTVKTVIAMDEGSDGSQGEANVVQR